MNDTAFPHPVYTETVLEPNFRDAQRWFLRPLLSMHQAHAVMLHECGILSAEDAKGLLDALRSLDPKTIAESRYDGSCEDLFFYVEGLLARACGTELGGKLHTARSRNDIDITLYRMALREEILALLNLVLSLQARLLGIGGQHAESLMPAYTHTQPAQPTTLGHYLMGVAECLSRDATRFRAAYATVNRSPLGACAITTTGFPISRQRTAALLGFDGLQQNSMGAIATIDYVAEAMSTIAILALGCGKFTQDLLLWSTREFGFLRVGDAWAQISSIMPQKRNPVAFEHARIQLSRAFAQAQAVLTCAHNTPFGDIVDSEDDLWPAVFRATTDAQGALRLLEAALADVEVNTTRMEALAHANFITVTEVADTLVREGGLSFRQAHEIVSNAVKACGPDDSGEAILAQLRISARELLGDVLPLNEVQLKTALDPRHFVAIRKVSGGPAPATLQGALRQIQTEHQDNIQWQAATSRKLKAAEMLLVNAASAVACDNRAHSGEQPAHV